MGAASVPQPPRRRRSPAPGRAADRRVRHPRLGRCRGAIADNVGRSWPRHGTIASVRALAICAALAACGRPEVPGAGAGAGPSAPGAQGPARRCAVRPRARRLRRPMPSPARGSPSGVAPTAYDLTLELDPDQASFTGRVAITIAVAAPGTARLWLHASTSASRGRCCARAGATSRCGGDRGRRPARGLRATPRGRPGIDRAGDRLRRPGHGPEPPRRQGRAGAVSRADGRPVVPVLAGRVGVRAPDRAVLRRAAVQAGVAGHARSCRAIQVALGNAPIGARDRVLPDGRREVRFAEIAALPSYLLAVAVGPFELVDAGRLGRAPDPGAVRGRRRATAASVGGAAPRAAEDHRRAGALRRRAAAAGQARPGRGPRVLRRDGEPGAHHVRGGDR